MKLTNSIYKIILTILLLTSFSSFAGNDEVADRYHQRIEERYPNVKFKSFRVLENNEIPQQIDELREQALEELLLFARSYDLFSLGWSYNNHPHVYEVTIEDDQVVLYTFSDEIVKNGVPTARRFYQAQRRVDGVFFISRVSDYNL